MPAQTEIVYLKHPVSTEEKRRLNKQGKRIIDIKFKPKEVEAVEKPKKRKYKKAE